MLLRAVRTCEIVGVAVADDERTVRFVDQAKGGFGGIADVNPHAQVARSKKLIVNEFQTRTMPFSKVLSQRQVPRTIDYLSLDVRELREPVPLVSSEGLRLIRRPMQGPGLLRSASSSPFSRFWQVEGAETLAMLSFPFTRHTISVMTVEGATNRLGDLMHAHLYRKLCWIDEDEVWVHPTTVLAPGVESQIISCTLEGGLASRRCEPLIKAEWNCSTLTKRKLKRVKRNGWLADRQSGGRPIGFEYVQ